MEAVDAAAVGEAEAKCETEEMEEQTLFDSLVLAAMREEDSMLDELLLLLFRVSQSLR